MSEISAKLIQWFIHHQRILPWRDNPEAYRVWISEIMLQQTRVQAVIPYYDRFLERFPSLQSLADSSLETVLHAWQGLGYYARARNLHQTAQIIMERFSGKFPTSYADVLCLPGIGKYTAAAILSIAFKQPYPVFDGNVMRVMARLFFISNDIRLPETMNIIESYLSQIFEKERASEFNQGMMELGALICLPKQPKCSDCPLSKECKAFRNGKQFELPIRSANVKPVLVNRIIFLIRKEDRVLINLREPKGLLASMWEFPGVETSLIKTEKQFKSDYGLEVKTGKKLLEAEHVFTHRLWKMKIYEGSIRLDTTLDEQRFRWVKTSELGNYPIPTAFKTILEYCRKELTH